MNDRGSAPANEVDERQVEAQSANWLANKKVWIAALSAVLILVLILGLILIPRGSDDQEAKRDSNSVEKSEGDTSVVLDSDGDGILDVVEVAGWKTEAGATYATDPKLADTDGDGLNDSEEAGAEVSEGVYKGVANPLKSDSDDDGLDDKTELAGGVTLDKRNFTLDPLKADTDGDQLSDLEELDNGTHANLVDTDGDGLEDFYEIYFIGTSALSKDTDGDGFEDAFEDLNREAEGLDPQFAEEEMSSSDLAMDVARGMLNGNADEEDSMAYLMGELLTDAAGFLPVVGNGVSLAVDIRDAVLTLVNSEYITPTLFVITILGAVKTRIKSGGLIKKVSKIIKRAPHLAATLALTIAKDKRIEGKLKKELFKRVWEESWEGLIALGATEVGLLKLVADGRMNLNILAAAIVTRPGAVKGPAVEYMKDGRDGEDWLKKNTEAKDGDASVRKVFKIDECLQECTSSYRSVDVLADGIAHESKVGYTLLTESVIAQIEADADLMKTGQIDGAQWHFFPSEIAQSGRLGPSEPLLNRLDQYGIKYTIHLPK